MPLSNNARIFYACQAVALEPVKPDLTASSVAKDILHGVQSVGINTTFNLEQVFELGQIHIYENIEGVPDVEVTLEKVLDGYPLMYHLASAAAKDDTSLTTNAAKTSLVARSKQRCNAALAIYPETVSHIGDGATGANETVEVVMSGMYISSVGYTIPVDGNATESLTLVGNHKQWNATMAGSKFTQALARTLGSGVATNSYMDSPRSLQPGTFYGGVQRRENVAINQSILPKSINGVLNNNSEGNGWDATKKTPRVHIQNISISCDLNRESVQELGRKSPYTRYANFPVEVTCEIEAITGSGDFINALEEGAYAVNTENYGNNTANETIFIRLHDGTTFDLGAKNRLSSVNYTGGDAGGGNVTTTYSYSTYNALNVYHPRDPIGGVNAISPPGNFKFNGLP